MSYCEALCLYSMAMSMVLKMEMEMAFEATPESVPFFRLLNSLPNSVLTKLMINPFQVFNTICIIIKLTIINIVIDQKSMGKFLKLYKIYCFFRLFVYVFLQFSLLYSIFIFIFIFISIFFNSSLSFHLSLLFSKIMKSPSFF